MNTSAPVLVTGGTGTLGSHVVPLLREAGHHVRILTRNSREPARGIEYRSCDLLEGAGLDEALKDVKTVLHLAGGPKGDDEATRNLVAAARSAGVRHLVYISVIGADRIPLAYFRAKLGAERAVADSGIPWTTLRAAQFHDLALTVAEKMGKLPVVPAPGGMRWQPVDAREVAARMAELTLSEPAGMVPELSGPTVYELGELVRSYLKSTGKRRPLLPVRMPGKVGRAYRAGENLAAHGGVSGTRTWEAFLAERTG
ncbi:SDR family oxidoreductase [Streptomyces rimosus]|uniref:SDR family oxidoreductase n=1 Tax=Streptomyces rimosus TaxID=1927 RepID=UPI0004C4E8D5|nr:SDR family oxidoreductase [Streptomyces rimosus]